MRLAFIIGGLILALLAGTGVYAFAAASHHTTAKAPTKSSWSLIYSDDFNSTHLNSHWITYNGTYAIGNNAWLPSEIKVNGGQGHIWFERKTTYGEPYTTGGMGLMGLSQTYGKYEFRIKLPRGKGLDPYAILWPQTNNHGDVEVDLFESPPTNKNKIYFTNHGNGHASQIVVSNNFADTFHTFTYEWTPGKLDFQIDGVEKGHITKNVPNFPMWFGMAIGSGDAFTGKPDSSTHLPVSYDIDWVHVYRYTGK